MENNIPTDSGTACAKASVAQWHGWPRGLAYKDSAWTIQELSNSLSSITDTATLSTAKADYDAVITIGGQFNQGGYPPLTVSIDSNKLAIVARYDNWKYNEKLVGCNLNKAKCTIDTTTKCLDTASEKMYVTVIYQESLTSWIGQWETLKLIVNWKTLGQNSRVRVCVDDTEVKDWSGLLGRHDEYGPYMKYGIYATTRFTYFNVKIKNTSSVVSNSI